MSNAQGHSNEGHGEDKEFAIYVNGRSKSFTGREISFEEVVALSGLATAPNMRFTVTYTRGHGDKPEGSLVAGETTKVKEGMKFDVTPTIRS